MTLFDYEFLSEIEQIMPYKRTFEAGHKEIPMNPHEQHCTCHSRLIFSCILL